MLNINDLKLDRFEIIDELDYSDSATKEKLKEIKAKVLKLHIEKLNSVVHECTFGDDGFSIQYQMLNEEYRKDGDFLLKVMKAMCDIMVDVQYYEEELNLLQSLTKHFKVMLGVTVAEHTYKDIYTTAEKMFNHVYAMLLDDDYHLKAFSELYEPHLKFKIVLA